MTVKIKINNYNDRENVVSSLVNSGYTVSIQTKQVKPLEKDYYVCIHNVKSSDKRNNKELNKNHIIKEIMEYLELSRNVVYADIISGFTKEDKYYDDMKNVFKDCLYKSKLFSD